MKKLSDVAIGQIVTIHSFSSDDIYIKLMEMGCIPGETIRIDKIAPLGDPICISVAGYHLSLRMNEAEHIIVQESEEII